MACGECLKAIEGLTLNEVMDLCRICPNVNIITVNQSKMLQCSKIKSLCQTIFNDKKGCPESMWSILIKPIKQ